MTRLDAVKKAIYVYATVFLAHLKDGRPAAVIPAVMAAALAAAIAAVAITIIAATALALTAAVGITHLIYRTLGAAIDYSHKRRAEAAV